MAVLVASLVFQPRSAVYFVTLLTKSCGGDDDDDDAAKESAPPRLLQTWGGLSGLHQNPEGSFPFATREEALPV